MTDNIETLARQQLDRRLDEIREAAPLLRAPRGGWILTLRNAMGMSQKILAERMGVSPQAISQLEQRESDGSVTVKALQQAAEKLGGELVYAIVPAKSIHETLESRALQIASRMTGAVRHTMRLEDQEPSSDLHGQTLKLARELASTPERLWSAPDGE
ncbi:MAG: mobile mystery protein A [Gemmatimonadaceae bacterium]